MIAGVVTTMVGPHQNQPIFRSEGCSALNRTDQLTYIAVDKFNFVQGSLAGGPVNMSTSSVFSK